MIPFQTPDFRDVTWVRPILESEGLALCNYSFPVLFCWKDAYGFQYAPLDRRLLIRLNSSLGHSYLWPVGEGDPTPALERVRELGVDLPVMIGEFHFGALDAGLTATGLEAVPNQEERAAAFRYYVERVAAPPLGVGCHYFQCYDQFVLGRFDGENYNIGLFDICLRPYGEMLQASRACAESAWAIHAGEAAPTQRRPQTIPMIAY